MGRDYLGIAQSFRRIPPVPEDADHRTLQQFTREAVWQVDRLFGLARVMALGLLGVADRDLTAHFVTVLTDPGPQSVHHANRRTKAAEGALKAVVGPLGDEQIAAIGQYIIEPGTTPQSQERLAIAEQHIVDIPKVESILSIAGIVLATVPEELVIARDIQEYEGRINGYTPVFISH